MVPGHCINGRPADKTYYEGTYPSDHWANIQPIELDHPRVVATTYYKDKQYSIFMNPTDKRGYRSIVLYAKDINGDRKSTFNRDYSSTERIGLALTIQLVCEAYERIVPISQSAIAGNVSQKFDSLTGITSLGTEKEPTLLHAHIFGSGQFGNLLY